MSNNARKDYRYQYYVEGQCEQKLLTVFKEQKTLILPGKIEVFNVIQESFTNLHLRTLSDRTIAILVFDTDIGETEIFRDNLRILRKDHRIRAVWCVLQVNNLEDELLRSTNVREIKDLINAPSNKDFKHYFVNEKRLFEKLNLHAFNFDKIWISHPKHGFEEIINDGRRIKL